jgi:hypothetical protein
VTGGPARAASRRRWRGALRAAAPALAGLVLGVAALGPALGPGFVLRYDMVVAPDPPLAWPAAGGFPRAVPSDLIFAAAARVLPAELVQKAILLGIHVLAAAGAAALVPGGRLVPRLAAAVLYAWNAYLAQRLLLGQWALLLGYAGLPWAVRAAARGGPGRLALALLPAAAGGFQAMLVSAPAVLAVAATRPGRSWRGLAGAGGVVAAYCLPWAVPALLSGASTDPAGVDAFAARADGPYGTAGSLLALGGIWNAEAEVPGQGEWLPATARLALCLAAIAVYLHAGRGRGAARPDWWAGLLAAAAAGLAVALTGAYLPGVLRALIAWWPGFGPLRDGQAYLAPLALLVAAGFGLLAARVTAPSAGRRPGPVWPVAAVVLLAPVLVLPGAAWGAFGRLDAVAYPAEWRRVQALVNGDPAPGALVSLPWSAHRAFPWNGGRVTLDPAIKMFARRVLWNDALTVGLPDGGVLRVAGEDPKARAVGALLAGDGPLTAALRARGVRYVLLAGPDRNTFQSRLPGGTVVHAGPELTVIRL